MRRLIPAVLAFATACGTSSRTPLVKVAPIQSELPADRQIDHVLSRLAYGQRPGDAERVKALGVERWIAIQLSPERIDDKVADSVLASFNALTTPTSELTAMF